MSTVGRTAQLLNKVPLRALLASALSATAMWVGNVGSVLAPEPVNLGAPLGSKTGATAAAVIIKQKISNDLIWPSTWTSGINIKPGSPCSTSPLPVGASPTKRIQALSATSLMRRCVPWDPLKPPSALFVRPLPPMPMDGGANVTGDALKVEKGVAVAVIEITEVINWPTAWHHPDGDLSEPWPNPGQPCSDFALMKGESTYKHIQESINYPYDHYYFRCVAMTQPTTGNYP